MTLESHSYMTWDVIRGGCYITGFKLLHNILQLGAIEKDSVGVYDLGFNYN